VLAGRGFGKTRMGSEWIRENVCGSSPLGAGPSGWHRVALVAETAADARDVMFLVIAESLPAIQKTTGPIGLQQTDA
jgi:phage terminase large subunit-like protein